MTLAPLLLFMDVKDSRHVPPPKLSLHEATRSRRTSFNETTQRGMPDYIKPSRTPDRTSGFDLVSPVIFAGWGPGYRVRGA